MGAQIQTNLFYECDLKGRTTFSGGRRQPWLTMLEPFKSNSTTKNVNNDVPCKLSLVLQQQLQEVNQKAPEYCSQLLKKQQEAEEYRLKLAATARQQPNGAEVTVLKEVVEVDSLVITSEDIKESVLAMLETDQPTDIAVETVTS